MIRGVVWLSRSILPWMDYSLTNNRAVAGFVNASLLNDTYLIFAAMNQSLSLVNYTGTFEPAIAQNS